MSLAQVSDVDKAVAAAKEAFEEGEWGKMNPRDRGRLIYKSVHFNFNTHYSHIIKQHGPQSDRLHLSLLPLSPGWLT